MLGRRSPNALGEFTVVNFEMGLRPGDELHQEPAECRSLLLAEGLRKLGLMLGNHATSIFKELESRLGHVKLILTAIVGRDDTTYQAFLDALSDLQSRCCALCSKQRGELDLAQSWVVRQQRGVPIR